VDGQSIQDFEVRLADNLYKLWKRLSSGSYMPPPVRRVDIPKANGGTRPLGIPTVADRIAQEVVRRRLDPLVEPLFHADSYGYRPGRSAIDAIRTARRRCWRYDWVLDLDIKGFFDSIDWTLLLRAVRKHADCPWVLLYIERWLKAPAMLEDGSLVPRERGTPQGGVISPLLANLFLHYVRVRSLAGAGVSRRAVRTVCRRHHLPLPQRARGPDVASGHRPAVRRLRAGAPSGEDPGGLLQGHQPQGRRRGHPVRLPRLSFPAAVDDMAGLAARRILSAGGQP
jgi:Retron-type reverse transcriptase